MQRSNSVFDRGVSYLTNAIVDLASQSMNPDPSIDHKRPLIVESEHCMDWPVPCGFVDEDSDYYSATR